MKPFRGGHILMYYFRIISLSICKHKIISTVTDLNKMSVSVHFKCSLVYPLW